MMSSKSLLAACALLIASAATLQADDRPVPVEKAPFHVPVFRNELVMLLNVYIPPGKAAGYHTHSLDQIGVLVSDAEMAGQVWGEQPTPGRRNPRGNVSFTAYSKKSYTHRTANVGTTPFNNVVIGLTKPEPGGFTVGSRAGVAQYEQIMDNERARGWRLTLEPGQSAAAITQSAPGIRIVIDGGELVESVPGADDRAMAPKNGEFFWQDAGTTRVVRNAGTTPIRIVEFELK
jgi:hypothetical protein